VKNALICLLAALTVSGCAADRSGDEGPGADLILLGGQVLTLLDTEPDPAPTAVAIRADRIIYVGDDAGARALQTATTQVIELAGRTVVPGFADSHAHLYGLGKALAEIDLVGTASATEVVNAVATAAAAQPGPGWLQGRGWDQNDWQVAVYPDRRLLDAVVPDRPVFLRRIDGHAAWANGAALAAAGISSATPDPAGGAILRDAAGKPTGILIDNAVSLIGAVIPPVSREEMRRRVEIAVQHCLSYGITAVHDAGVSWVRFGLYRDMAAAGALELRVYGFLDDEPETLARGFAAGPYLSDDGMLTVRAVKLYADGALGSRGALLLQDYSDDAGNRGLLVTPLEHLREVARAAAQHGFQVCTHAIGDGANRLVLDLYEEVFGSGNQARLADQRWRIEHAQIIAASDLPRFGRLGVIAAMQPLHCTSDMDWAVDRLGPERISGAYAWRSLLDTGASICFGTDFPVEEVDPLAGLYAARTRSHQDGTPVGGWLPAERLDARTALLLYTRASAHAAFMEEELGAVAPGFLADLTVLSDDPLAIEAIRLLNAQVVMTIVAGKIRYDKS